MNNTEIFKYICSQGIFCALFVWLLWDTRKQSKELLQDSNLREQKYQETISKLADQFNGVEDIKQDVEDIKNKIK